MNSGSGGVMKKNKNYCPICDDFFHFNVYGISNRVNAECTNCGSLERHRLLWMFLHKKLKIENYKGTNKSLLHIAPENCFNNIFTKIFGEKYLTADLNSPDVKEKMDITNIQHGDNTFDFIICNHVLEHIVDDIKALEELYRVLKNIGWLILTVPIKREKTKENFLIQTENERLVVFGQSDHVRIYGKDFIRRLSSVNFYVTAIKANDFITDTECNKMSCPNDKTLFFCTKKRNLKYDS